MKQPADKIREFMEAERQAEKELQEEAEKLVQALAEWWKGAHDDEADS